MTLKQFIDMIGNFTDKDTTVVIHKGMNNVDDGKLRHIRNRLKNKYYVQEFEGWSVDFFNIIDGELIINMTIVK